MQKILARQLTAAEQIRNHFCLTPLPETTKAEMLEPAAWAHVAKQLTRGDRIDVFAADGSWFLQLIVRETNDLGASVGEVAFVEFPLPVADTRPVEIAFAGSTDRWRVTRDKIVLGSGFATKQAAMAWANAPISTAATAST